MSYACYLSGLKKHFKTLGLSNKQFLKVEKMLEQSDNRRTDVKRIHIKYTRDQPLGYKLEKLPKQSRKEIKAALPSQTAALIKRAEECAGLDDNGEEHDAIFMQMLDVKRSAAASLLLSPVEPILKEISEKYAPLHELKMQSKIEGIEIGLEQTAIEQKIEYQAE